ncbi:hypothetical protein NUH88_18835 [Nisaea acidiphila]|uniref:Uncharacterized protein n=1 Tax=Nisaea acidiphila TaxID=1862145 RepID=A0A9J7ASY5_9PROT|nr:hypothetical protein [Nisaea acidiphila]UUX49444.1 hypothetical protein NUH88_18835 [Nisaea acidiphila]
MSLSSALKAGLGARLKDLSGTGAGADWDPYPEDGGEKASAKAKLPAKAAPKQAAPQSAKQPLRTDRAAAVAPVARAPRPANANSAVEAPAAPKTKSSRAKWLQEKGAAIRVNPQQYARELDRYMNEQNRHLTQETVMEVAAGELEGVAQMAAKARGRYFAKLLDSGAPRHGFLQEAEVAELRFYREMYEEMTRGFEAMRDAIEAGDISVLGMKRP